MKRVHTELFPELPRRKAARRYGHLADDALVALIVRLEAQIAAVIPSESLLSSRLHSGLLEALLAARAEVRAPPGMNDAGLFLALVECERLASMGATASHCVVRAAQLHAVDPHLVAVHWLDKLLGCNRARAELALLLEGDAL